MCSPALAESRGTTRPVSLVPNGVDVEHFRRPRPRPSDLPAAPTAVYVGSLHDARLDVELVAELADALPELNVVLVGPDSLGGESQSLLASRPNVYLLGARPYEVVPAYLQHADVVIVPHRVTPFTDSLDPIKAYECLAIDTPTVATPVAGFRIHADVLDVVDREAFPALVRAVLTTPPPRPSGAGRGGLMARPCGAFESVLDRVSLPPRPSSSRDRELRVHFPRLGLDPSLDGPVEDARATERQSIGSASTSSSTTPTTSDLILFCQCHMLPRDWRLTTIREHPLAKKLPRPGAGLRRKGSSVVRISRAST